MGSWQLPSVLFAVDAVEQRSRAEVLIHLRVALPVGDLASDDGAQLLLRDVLGESGSDEAEVDFDGAEVTAGFLVEKFEDAGGGGIEAIATAVRWRRRRRGRWRGRWR